VARSSTRRRRQPAKLHDIGAEQIHSRTGARPMRLKPVATTAVLPDRCRVERSWKTEGATARKGLRASHGANRLNKLKDLPALARARPRSHGKEGSTVRVRQRASRNLLQSGVFCLRARRRAADVTSTERPRLTPSARTQRAETAYRSHFAGSRSDVHRTSMRSRRRRGSRGPQPRAHDRRGRGDRGGGRSSPGSRP
jgi:hypothetical protein